MKMKNYILIGLIVITVIVTGFFIYQANTLQNTNPSQQKKQSNIPTIKFEGLRTIINLDDKNCDIDNDCVLFQSDCEDCKFDTLNKEMLQKYTEAKNEYCSINKPMKMCDIVFTGKLKCINNKCVIE